MILLTDITNSPLDVISIGNSLKLGNVITKSKLILNQDTVVALNGGISIKVGVESLKDFYLDTQENRSLLKSLIIK